MSSTAIIVIIIRWHEVTCLCKSWIKQKKVDKCPVVFCIYFGVRRKRFFKRQFLFSSWQSFKLVTPLLSVSTLCSCQFPHVGGIPKIFIFASWVFLCLTFKSKFQRGEFNFGQMYNREPAFCQNRKLCFEKKIFPTSMALALRRSIIKSR